MVTVGEVSGRYKAVFLNLFELRPGLGQRLCVATPGVHNKGRLEKRESE
jgi:hypothetical protein